MKYMISAVEFDSLREEGPSLSRPGTPQTILSLTNRSSHWSPAFQVKLSAGQPEHAIIEQHIALGKMCSTIVLFKLKFLFA